MDELIKVNKNTIGGDLIDTVDARELWAFLKVKTDFSHWIKNRFFQYGFAHGVDYIDVKTHTQYNQIDKIEYHITLDMAKELSMVERSSEGKRARKYFIARDKELSKVQSGNFNDLPKSFSEALQLAADQAKQIEEQKPKVNFFEKVVNADGLHDIAQVAKMLKLGYGRNTLFKKLREKKILMKNNTPYQQYVDLEYFEVKENVIKFVKKGTDEENEVLKSQTFVTGKGLTWLERKLSA